ncbi:MAG TPA: ABC transporter permease [Candidatus Udaeobacter sp.]|nr:ABC transporter permease [Candidatus Udaeobacter sp.]
MTATTASIALLIAISGCGGAGSSTTPSADLAFYGSGIQVAPPAGQSTLAVTKIDEIKQVPGVKAAFPTYRFDAGSGAIDPAGVAVSDMIVASDPTEAAWSGLKTTYAQGHAIDADSSAEVVLGSTIARTLGKKLGDTVTLPTHPANGAASHSFNVVGILGATGTAPDRFAYVNITDGQMLLKDALPAGQTGNVDVTSVATAIDVYAKTGTAIADLDKLADHINSQVQGVKAIKPSQLVDAVRPS